MTKKKTTNALTRPLALLASGQHHERHSELIEARAIATELGDRTLLSVIEGRA